MKDRLLQDDKKMLKEIAVKADVKTMKNETKMVIDCVQIFKTISKALIISNFTLAFILKV